MSVLKIILSSSVVKLHIREYKAKIDTLKDIKNLFTKNLKK